MKRIYYILCAAAVLSGCQKQEFEPQGNGDTGQLVFNTSLDGMPVAQTRAAGTDADLTTHGFYLAGYHTEGLIDATAATAFPNVFDKETADGQSAVPLVTYTEGKFTLKTIKWALDDVSYVSFFGWSQSKAIPTGGITTATTGIIGHTKDENGKGYPWIDIRNADAPADQTDVVGTRSLNHKNDAVISAVDLDFCHLLSKLSFKAKSSSGAKITITAVDVKYATNKVHRKARYTFGSDAAAMGTYGSFSEYHSVKSALKSSYPAITDDSEVFLGSTLLLPQELAAGDLSLEIRYKLSPNSGDIPGDLMTKTVPLPAFTFEQGKNYTYTIDVQAAEISMGPAPIIDVWEVSSLSPLPTVPGPKSNVLLLLDGYDIPYTHSDGKRYWLDRSGWNHHLELGGGYQSYDATKHAYVFNRSGLGGQVVSNMGDVTNVTFDVVAEGSGTATPQVIFQFPSMSLEAPHSGTNRLDWNYPGSFMSWTAPTGENINARRILWTTTAGSLSEVYQNGILKMSKITTAQSVTLNNNRVANLYAGAISYLKVTKEKVTAQGVADNYVEIKDRFDAQTGLPNIGGPRGDLRLLLDGQDAPYTLNGAQYWLDRSGYNNHMLLTNAVPGKTGTATYNASKKCYEFDMSQNKNGSTLPFESFADATIEVISERTSNGTGTAPFILSSFSETEDVLALFTGWGTVSHLYVKTGNNTTTGVGRYASENLSLSSGTIKDKRLWTVVSGNSPNTMRCFYNAVDLGTQNMSMTNRLTQHKAITADVTGCVGNVYYIRVTAAKKTTQEVTAAHNELKAIFNY